MADPAAPTPAVPTPAVPAAAAAPAATAGTTPGSSLLTAGGIVLAIGGLYFGRDIFVPFALAILLAFALAPLVNWLRRLRLPRVLAVILAVSFAFVVIGGIAFVVGTQLVQLANNLPTYQSTIREKIHTLQSSASGSGVVDRVTATLENLSQELQAPEARPPTADNPVAATVPAPQREPVLVEIQQPEAQPIEVLRTIVGPLLAPLATAGIVVVFVIFVLLERQDLRDRFIKLVGAGDLQKSTQALDDAAARVSRYLLMQLIVNLTYGVPIGVGLWFIGVPNAVLWGLLAAVLRFVPYLGPFLAAMFPLALAFAVDPGWSMLIWVGALFLISELISNNVVEPWLYGSSTGLSSLAVITAAIFWTTLWGPVGLFLSTPLTVCLVVIGRYVPQLSFLGVLLGSDPVLAPEERLYQRLLAGNLEEAVEIAEAHVDETSSREFFEQVAFPALRLAENDRQRSIDVAYRRVVAETAICVVREISDYARPDSSGGETRGDGDHAAARPQVLCIAGRTELDRAASEMLAEVLREDGIGTAIMAPIAVSPDALGQLDLTGVQVVCLSYMNPQPQVFARYVCRRLKRRAPQVKLVVCLWNPPPDIDAPKDLPARTGADAVVVTLDKAIRQVETWIQPPPSAGGEPAPAAPDDERERQKALEDLGLAGARAGRFSDVTAKVAEAFGVPFALVSLVDGHHGDIAHDPSRDPGGGAPSAPELSMTGEVIAADEVVVVEDISKDKRFAENPWLLEKGIRFYAGAPLRAPNGVALGSLAIIDTRPRTLTDSERRLLQVIADGLISNLKVDAPEALETKGVAGAA